MRKGTQASLLFGNLLFELRTEREMSMGQVARKLGGASSLVSEVEKAQRAVKEEKLALWADALDVDESFLRDYWISFQKEFPEPPIVKGRRKREFQELVELLTSQERERVTGYIHRLVEERTAADI